LNTGELNVDGESFREVESGEGGEKIENDVVVEHVVRIRVETLQVEGREEISDVRGDQS